MKIKSKILDILYNSPLEVSINMKLRYMPVVSRLKKIREQNKNLKVLEIGSGSKGITRFFKYPVIGMDIEFQKHKNRYLKEVKSSAAKRFPFKDNEFDVVISVDSIEHVPSSKREKALKEMLRVSNKHVIIACPVGMSKWDKKVLDKWPKSSATYKNIKEHLDMGFPDPIEIVKPFKGCKIKMAYGAHPGLEYFIKLMERNIVGKAFARTILKIFMPFFTSIKGKSRRVYFIEKK